MRVAVYVPADAPERYRRRGEAQCRRKGHEFVGFVDSPAAAAAAVSAGVADRVAAHPAHLPDLVPWVVVLPPLRPGGAAAGPAAMAAGCWAALKEHPLRAGTVAAGLAATAGLLLVVPLPDPGGPERAVPPAPAVTSSPPGSLPGPAPAESEPPGRPVPHPPNAAGSGGEQPPPTAASAPAAPGPGQSAPPSPPAEATLTPSPTTPPLPSPTAVPEPPEAEPECLVRLEVLGIRVAICI